MPANFFPAGVDQDPEFLRWGYWAADVKVRGDDSGDLRHDTVPLGFWVAGPDQDPASLPFAGTAESGGLVAASLRDLDTDAVSSHGGEFKMTYNFGAAQGDFAYAIASANIGDNLHVLGPGFGPGGALDATFAGDKSTIFEAPGAIAIVETQVQGTFYGIPGNPAAAVGGTIGIVDQVQRVEGQAIFGGDQLSFTPDPGS